MSRLIVDETSRAVLPDEATKVDWQDEGGFTMVELLIAMLLMAIVFGALALSFSSNDSSSLAVQRQAELLAVADQQIEHVRAQVKTYGFAALAMNALPRAATSGTVDGEANNPADPNSYVTSISSGCGTYDVDWGDQLATKGYKIEANYNQSTGGTVTPFTTVQSCASGVEPLVVLNGGDPSRTTQPTGFVSPLQTPVAIGAGTGSVYTYVTHTNVGCNASGGCDGSLGTSGPDAVRVTVAVTLNRSGGRTDIGGNAPVYVSTVFTNPVPSNQPNKSLGLTLGVNVG